MSDLAAVQKKLASHGEGELPVFAKPKLIKKWYSSSNWNQFLERPNKVFNEFFMLFDFG